MYFPANGALNMLLMLITKIAGGKRVMFTGPGNTREVLTYIRELVENGNFKPVVDRKYPLEKIGEAFSYVATGQKIGNVIITMDEV